MESEELILAGRDAPLASYEEMEEMKQNERKPRTGGGVVPRR